MSENQSDFPLPGSCFCPSWRDGLRCYNGDSKVNRMECAGGTPFAKQRGGTTDEEKVPNKEYAFGLLLAGFCFNAGGMLDV